MGSNSPLRLRDFAVKKHAMAKSKNITASDRKLTKREAEILRLIASGYNGRQIAEKLFTSERTVDTHRTRIRNKTRCRNAAKLTRYALENGFLNEKFDK